jgi:methyl-accepting chemotaxis protein
MTNSEESRLDRISTVLEQTAEFLQQSARRDEDRHNRTIAELRELRLTAEEQARTIRQFVSIVAEQARTIADITRSMRDAVEASQRSAQAAEASAVIAQNNQNAIRDLIEEMRNR